MALREGRGVLASALGRRGAGVGPRPGLAARPPAGLGPTWGPGRGWRRDSWVLGPAWVPRARPMAGAGPESGFGFGFLARRGAPAGAGGAILGPAWVPRPRPMAGAGPESGVGSGSWPGVGPWPVLERGGGSLAGVGRRDGWPDVGSLPGLVARAPAWPAWPAGAGR